MIENSRESVTYRLHAIPTLPPRWNDQIVPSADLVFSLLFLSLFFFCWFSFLILLREILEKFFEFFGDFSFFLFLLFFYWICRTSFISLSSLTGILENFFEFFLFFVELDLFDRRFSFSRWLFLIRIVDNFFEFFFFFVRFLELRNLFFCRWFSYPSVNYSFFIEVFEIIFELLMIFLFEILTFFESLCSFPYRFYSIYLEVFEKTSLSPLFTDFSLLFFVFFLNYWQWICAPYILLKGQNFVSSIEKVFGFEEARRNRIWGIVKSIWRATSPFTWRRGATFRLLKAFKFYESFDI